MENKKNQWLKWVIAFVIVPIISVSVGNFIQGILSPYINVLIQTNQQEQEKEKIENMIDFVSIEWEFLAYRIFRDKWEKKCKYDVLTDIKNRVNEKLRENKYKVDIDYLLNRKDFLYYSFAYWEDLVLKPYLSICEKLRDFQKYRFQNTLFVINKGNRPIKVNLIRIATAISTPDIIITSPEYRI